MDILCVAIMNLLYHLTLSTEAFLHQFIVVYGWCTTTTSTGGMTLYITPFIQIQFGFSSSFRVNFIIK